MRFFLTIICAAALASAFTVPKRNNDGQVPACATECVTGTDPAPCDPNDVACICLNIDYSQKIGECVVKSCSEEDAQAAAAVGEALCKKAGVDIQNPIPECGISCFTNGSTGDCSADDGTCLCNNHEFIKSVDACLKDSCTGQDLKTAEFVGKALCRAYGVDISPIVDY